MKHQHYQPDYDYDFRTILIGDAGVGKSSIVARLTGEWGRNTKTRLYVAFASKRISVEDQVIRAQIWDTAGEERYQAVGPMYYRGAVGALLVYDITKYQTFASVERWLEELKKNSRSSTVVMLVGNKSDSDSLRAVSYEEGAAFAEKHGLGFIETSAFDNRNVDEAFEKVVKEIYQNVRNGVAGYDNVIRRREDNERKSGCC